MAGRAQSRGVTALAAAALVAGLLLPVSAGAVVPGDNGQIVFETNRDGDPEIFVMNADGTIERNLTNNDVADFYPVWSPDSTEIAWGQDTDPGPGFNVDVHVMDADGTNVRRLTDTPGEDRGASWSSDGSRIVFHSARNRTPERAFDLMVMDADGSDQEVLFPDGSAGYVCANPHVPNTDRVVFNSNRSGAFEIYTANIDPDDVDLVQVTSFGDFNSGPKWSPDCESIVFNRFDAGGSLDVYRIDADGDENSLVNLTNSPGTFEAFAAWSPDGQRFVFSSNRDVNFEIYSADTSDGGNVVALTDTKRGQANFRADWGTADAYTGPPTNKDQCKGDEWQVFTTPSFANQGDCVAFVESSAP